MEKTYLPKSNHQYKIPSGAAIDHTPFNKKEAASTLDPDEFVSDKNISLGHYLANYSLYQNASRPFISVPWMSISSRRISRIENISRLRYLINVIFCNFKLRSPEFRSTLVQRAPQQRMNCCSHCSLQNNAFLKKYLR